MLPIKNIAVIEIEQGDALVVDRETHADAVADVEIIGARRLGVGRECCGAHERISRHVFMTGL